jgi:hypothetical protein
MAAAPVKAPESLAESRCVNWTIRILIVHLTHSRPPPSRLGHGSASGRARHRPRAPVWPWLAPVPVKAPESLTESQMRQLDNQDQLYDT